MDFKQTLDLITAGASIFGSLVIVFTALAAFRQLAHMRNANEISAFTAIVERWQSPETAASLHFVRTELPALLADPTFIAELEAPEIGPRIARVWPLVNLLEEMGTLTSIGILSDRAVLANYALIIRNCWDLCEPVVRARRRALHPGMGVQFEDLAARATDWMANEAPELEKRLRKMPDTTRERAQA